MKFRIEILAIIIFYGCSNLSPNEGQIRRSLTNLDCYQRLITQIKDDDQFREELIKIRESKIRGTFDPITVKQEFRLIDMNEIIEKLDSNWISKCKERIEKENDFRGIRIIDKEVLIIEIDEFNRHTLTEQYSRGKTKEFHRLINSNRSIDNTKFYFGTEHQVWRDTIEENLIYEVTQLKMIH